MKTILAFSGSSRTPSLNTRLLHRAADMARDRGAVVESLDLRALNLPLYDGDLEAANGLPDGARILKEAMKEADALLIASPEYNSFPTPLLLNALDWASRKDLDDEPPLAAFQGKTAGLISASPGPLGGLRSLTFLRGKLQNMGVTVIPSLAAVGGATLDLFEDDEFPVTHHGRRVGATLDALLRTSL